MQPAEVVDGSFQHYCNTVSSTYQQFKAGWRVGQTAFNVLNAMRPDLSEQVRGSNNLDPFYQDELLSAFYDWVEKHWDDNEPQSASKPVEIILG